MRRSSFGCTSVTKEQCCRGTAGATVGALGQGGPNVSHVAHVDQEEAQVPTPR
jgi:hypothetical protein